jgi:hypothetical protein
MASNRLKLQSERRKLQLKAAILNNRARVAQLQQQTALARQELKTFKSAQKADPFRAGKARL